VGGALSPLLVVPLMATLGWRAAFHLFAALGLVWALVWYSWYRDHPAGSPKLTSPGAQEATATAAGHGTIPWGTLFRSRQLWLILAAAWCYGWGATFYLSWFHTYLVKGRGLTEEEMKVYAALPFLFGMVGNLSGGFVSDRLSQKYGLRAGRRLVGSVSLGAAALLMLVTTLTEAKVVAVLALALAYGTMDCMLPSAWANCLDVGGRFAGAVSGAMNSAVQAGGFLCVVLFGYLVEGLGGYRAPLWVIAALLLLSALLFARIDPTRPLVAVVEEETACD
jgi:predicted MFS family arabinose efflux permease